MSHKTKAAKTGRHCYYSEGSSAVQGILTFVCSSCIWRNHPKLFAAGGQNLSAPVIKGTAPLAHTPFPQIWGEQDQRAGCTAMQHTPERSRSFDKYPDIGCYGLHKIAPAVLIPVPGSSLAHLQWRIFNHVVTSLSHSFLGLAGSECGPQPSQLPSQQSLQQKALPYNCSTRPW